MTYLSRVGPELWSSHLLCALMFLHARMLSLGVIIGFWKVILIQYYFFSELLVFHNYTYVLVF